jgi:hypothetical protein
VSCPLAVIAVTRHSRLICDRLKTRDIQSIFSAFDQDKGGFRIKWLDDVNALIVFNDPSVGRSSVHGIVWSECTNDPAKRAYLGMLLKAPTLLPPPAQIRPYDRPDAAAIIAQLSARAMGHRSAASGMNSISTLAEGRHSRGISYAENNNGAAANGATGSVGNGNGIGGGINTFVMPTKRHGRTGSASASWARTSMGSMGSMGAGSGGVLNFPSSSSGRLPTHSESSADPSRVSSSSGEDDRAGLIGKAGGGRRDSLSAEKALREVQKALSGGVGVGA